MYKCSFDLLQILIIHVPVGHHNMITGLTNPLTQLWWMTIITNLEPNGTIQIGHNKINWLGEREDFKNWNNFFSCESISSRSYNLALFVCMCHYFQYTGQKTNHNQLNQNPLHNTAVHKQGYCTAVHKNSLQYSCTQNQFTS